MKNKVYVYGLDGKNANRKIMAGFAKGCNGELVSYEDGHIKEGILVLRSRGPQAAEIIKECWKSGQTFLFIDTGYFLNSQIKTYHRITKNHFQNFKIVERPSDRWEYFQRMGVKDIPWKKTGRSILVCPPTSKSLNAYDFTPDDWKDSVMKALPKIYPDKEIILREKPKLDERRQGDTLQEAIVKNDVFAVASCHGGVAIESALMGIPSYVHEHNAAAPIAQTDLSKPVVYPDKTKWLCSISYDQFNMDEIINGKAFDEVMKS